MDRQAAAFPCISFTWKPLIQSVFGILRLFCTLTALQIFEIHTVFLQICALSEHKIDTQSALDD